MARTSIYLNFMGKTEEAFNFYKKVFGTEFTGVLQRIGEVPPGPGMPTIPAAEKNMIMHIELPILGGLVLMGTDALESMGHHLTFGNNISINLEPDTRTETDTLFKELSDGGKVNMAMMEMFWGGYFGACTDKYGVLWMFNTTSKV